MSQGNSIFSNSPSSNGSSPSNPFASLSQKAASPFAAAQPESEETDADSAEGARSPFGFAEEEARPVLQSEQTRLPERRSFDAEASAKTALPTSGNPFSASPSAPMSQKEPDKGSPFAPSVGFEASPAPTVRESFDRPAESYREPQPQPQAAAYAPVASAPQQAAAASTSRGQSTRQLELRAIFGVEGEMSREQILQQARDLPGIREISVVGSGEMTALDTIGEVMSRFGYGGNSSWQISCSGGVVDFVSGENTTLAILREGRYPAGVWEKLMIVARELGRLG